MSHWKGYGTIGLARSEVPCHEVDREVKICAPERQRLAYRRLTKWITAGLLQKRGDVHLRAQTGGESRDDVHSNEQGT